MQVMKKIIAITLSFIGFTLVSEAQKNKKDLSSAVLTDWLDFHCKMVRSATGIPHVSYSRHFAYTAIAAYESIVSSNSSYQSLAGQLTDLKKLPAAPKEVYWPASLNAAYAAMMREFYASFGANKNRIDSMEEVQRTSFAKAGISEKLIGNAEIYGKAIAASVLGWSGADSYNSTKEFTPEKGEGLWEPTPPSFTAANVPYWSEKRSFTNNLFSVFSLAKPLYASDTATDFYKMAKEVYDVSRNLTPEQRAIGLYWDDSPNGKYMTVFGHWTSILNSLIKTHDLSLIKATEAFAVMSMSMHEASILAWKGKYENKVVRPITYIQKHIDKTWTPLIATPPHPEFPAAHATLSNAAAIALCAFFGETCALTDKSYIDIGMAERSYPSLQEAAKEAGYSRLYGGIHYRYSIEQGFLLGAAAANKVLKEVSFEKK
jgi:hypothetical protein